MTTLDRINALETERQALLNTSDDWSFADESRRKRLADIKTELERAWDTERQQRATQMKLRIEQAQRQQRQRS
jgi:hypothetical protein